ncbi:ankyrin repeat domain-containing protein [Mangrovivirga cuniculi]|uniref:Uncharacterized protein n=1 Tax=Mangrovivirga cuniculi TaxID=2715131 RepID=A0A4D7K1S3_9BACT|nr:ankyrin repeat domain-containing protein [Mangrovivirga cuniculi]QCK14824.1 hypothetical protein DCC35_08765 [Mangrovivirga cuniculi]
MNQFIKAVENNELTEFSLGLNSYYLQDPQIDEHWILGQWKKFIIPAIENDPELENSVIQMLKSLIKNKEHDLEERVESLLYHLYVYFYFKDQKVINFEIEEITENINAFVEEYFNYLNKSKNATKLNELSSSIESIKRKGGLPNLNLDFKNYQEEFEIAVARGEKDKVKQLLENRPIDINKSNEFGYPPLHNAIRKKNEEVALYLIDQGAEIDKIDADGYPPVYYTVKRNLPKVLESLISQGANLNFRDEEGNNLIWLALMTNRGGDNEIVEILLDKGVDPKQKNFHGVDALGLLSMPKNDSVKSLFMDFL